MMSQKKEYVDMDARRRKYIIFISILLHILFLALWEAGIKLDVLTATIPQKPPASEPIVLDLQQPPPQNVPREVIETPEDAKVVEKQDKANFLSDKNALARNPETNPNVKLGEAFSRGDLDSHELPQQEGPQGKTQEVPRPESKPNEQKPVEQEQEVEVTDALAALLQQPMQIPLVPPGVQARPPMVRHDNPESRAEEMGGLSFNTYNWDFAPYLLMLKRRIYHNIFPPPAFSQLGIIDGETLLRFKIYPNGQLKDLEILNYNGHESLMLTSQNAIVSSAPFPELPSNFPEQYLEVTGKFVYFVRR